MPRQWSVREVLQGRTTNLPFPVPACRGEKYAVSVPVLRCLVFGLLFMKYWESDFLPFSEDVRRGVIATVGKELPRRSIPVAEDVRYFPTFTFAKAKFLFPSLSPPNRRAAQPDGLAAEYVLEAGARAERGHGDATESSLRPTGDPHSGERNVSRSSKADRHRKVTEPTYFSEAVADEAGKQVIDNKVQPLEENQAGTLRRILHIFARRSSDAAETESTERTAVENEITAHTPQGISRKEALVHRGRRGEQKASAAANEQQNSDEVADTYDKFENSETERMNGKAFSTRQDDANRVGIAEHEKGSRISGVTSVDARVPAFTEPKAAQKLQEEQIEKIRRGLKFTQKFDFDQACEEARQASSVRLVWNIVYTDELVMAQKLYEKMDAYVLRQYIALLKRERELQKIRIVGNSQLMSLLRSLLKREHIKTTKTDAEIGKLFPEVPRLFDWIPPVEHGEEQSHSTTRKRSGVEEL